MNIVGIIVGRISSTRLPRKNMLDFCGRPMIEWTIRQAVFTKQVNHNFLVTDSHKMAEIAKEYNVEIIFHPQDAPNFGGPGGGGAAFNYAWDYLGSRTKVIDAFVNGHWGILKKPDDWDCLISMFKERKAGSVHFAARVMEAGFALDTGGNHFFSMPRAKDRRLLNGIIGGIQSRAWRYEDQLNRGLPGERIAEKTRPATVDEIEKGTYFYELEPWQSYGNIDYQYQFEIAEWLFHKNILKGGAKKTPYKDYYDNVSD